MDGYSKTVSGRRVFDRFLYWRNTYWSTVVAYHFFRHSNFISSYQQMDGCIETR